MRKTSMFLLACVLFVSLIGLGPVAGAFSDLHSDPHAHEINALKKAGILKGEANGKFNPRGKLSYAAGITGIVNGFELSLAHFTFSKAPQASDYFTHVKDDAWYAQAFVIAHLNGIELPKDVKPNKAMTRQEFAHYLFQAIQTTGEYFYTEQFIEITDQQEINKAYSDSIQKLLITNIASLDKKKKFHPQKTITRSEAFSWLYKAMQFVKTMREPLKPVEPTTPFSDFRLESKAINANVKEVTISAQAPHPGYGLRISSISFVGKQAIIYTEAILPDPDKFYPQVITEVQATTYIASTYKPVLADQPVSTSVY